MSYPFPESSTNKSITIITPCSRPENLSNLLKSIDLSKIAKWIIVYDTSNNRSYNHQFSHAQIVELECANGISGNPQRNFGIEQVDNGFIYFLDDDNIIHPAFWELTEGLDPTYFYTFDQQRTEDDILRGRTICVCEIDTAMFIVHRHHIRDIRWVESEYIADGLFISDIAQANPRSHIYIPKIRCYYNYLC
jgi:hypothetical protein